MLTNDVEDDEQPPRRFAYTSSMELSPVADVAPALPLLKQLSKVLAGRDLDVKVAALRWLADKGSGPWRIEELQELLHWLEPSSATRAVGLLREAGVLELRRRTYFLTAHGRSIMWLLDVICRPSDPSAVIREIDALIAHARARGDDWPYIMHLVAMGIGHLRDVRSDLASLLQDGTPAALLEAAKSAKSARDQMDRLHESHAAMLDSHRLDGDAGPLLTESSELVGAISQLLFRAHRLLARDVHDLRRLGARVDRGDVDKFLAEIDDATLASLLDGHVMPPASVVAPRLGEALQTLRTRPGRHVSTMAVPPAFDRLPTVGRDDVADDLGTMVQVLGALHDETPLEDVLVGESWSYAVRQSVLLLEALALDDDKALPKLEVRSGTQREVGRGGVARGPDGELVPREDDR